MEKIVVYFKLLQIVLTLAFICKLLSLHQFCGTFADPKAFIHENISVGYCKRFTLIGKESKSGEFGVVFDQDKWQNQLSMSSTNGRPIEEQQHQFMDELAAKLPPAGRICIPITITPFDWFVDWIGLLDRNPLNNDTLFYFSLLFLRALDSLIALCFGITDLLLNVEEYKFWAYYIAFASVISWYFSAAASFNMLFNWTDFWTCFNFRADRTIVQFDTFVLSIVMVFLYGFEIFLQDAE